MYEVCRETFKSGALRSEEERHDGRRHGFYREFHAKNPVRGQGRRQADGGPGAVKEQGQYRYDRKHGPWQKLTLSGMVEKEERWQDGLHDGPTRRWVVAPPSMPRWGPWLQEGPPPGPHRLLVAEEWWKCGKRVHVHCRWDDRVGTLIEEVPYCQGKKHGDVRQYTPGEFLFKVSGYSAGEQHGACKCWYLETKTLKWEQEWERDKKHGAWREYHANGALESVSHYCSDKSFGTWKTKSPDGRVLSKTSYRNGRRHGLHEEWHEGGRQLQQRAFYKHGKIHGPKQAWYWNGRLESVMSYRNGTRDGFTIYCHNDGSLLSIVVHREGKQVPLLDFNQWRRRLGEARRLFLIMRMQLRVRMRLLGTDQLAFMRSMYERGTVYSDGDAPVLWMARRHQQDTDREERRWQAYRAGGGTDDREVFLEGWRHRQWMASTTQVRKSDEHWNADARWVAEKRARQRAAEELEGRWRVVRSRYLERVERKERAWQEFRREKGSDDERGEFLERWHRDQWMEKMRIWCSRNKESEIEEVWSAEWERQCREAHDFEQLLDATEEPAGKRRRI